MLIITWLQNNYSKLQQANVTLQNIMWWVATGTQGLLQCTPNTNKQCLENIRLQNVFDLSHITTRTWLWKFTLLLIMAEKHLSKNKAAGGMRTISDCQEAVSEHWFEQIHATIHTKILHFSVQLHSRYFCHIVFYRPCSRRRPFLQADISLKRYCPWKIWPFILMLTQINDPNPQ